MWLLILTSNAWATPTGEPLPHPELGRLTVRITGDVESVPVEDSDCGDSSPCEALWKSSMAGVEAQWSPLPGLGIAGELGYQNANSTEADFRGAGLAYALSLRGAMPLTERWWLAGHARYSATSLKGGEGSTASEELATLTTGTVGASLVWSEIMDGPSAWIGAQSTVLWNHTIFPSGESSDLEIPTTTKAPVSAVGGLAIRSDSLGVPWEDSLRISIGIEGRVGQSSGAGTWIGLSW